MFTTQVFSIGFANFQPNFIGTEIPLKKMKDSTNIQIREVMKILAG